MSARAGAVCGVLTVVVIMAAADWLRPDTAAERGRDACAGYAQLGATYTGRDHSVTRLRFQMADGEVREHGVALADLLWEAGQVEDSAALWPRMWDTEARLRVACERAGVPLHPRVSPFE